MSREWCLSMIAGALQGIGGFSGGEGGGLAYAGWETIPNILSLCSFLLFPVVPEVMTLDVF